MKNITSPGRLSISELRSLAHLTSAEELRCIDAQQLPLFIPTDLVHEVSHDKKPVIEDFIFDISVNNLEMNEKFGPQIHQVLTAASSTNESRAYTEFNTQVKKILNIYKSIEINFNLGSINNFYHLRKSSLKSLKKLKEEVSHVQSLFDFTLENHPIDNANDENIMEIPAKDLHARLSSMQKLIGTYNRTCLCISGQHMQHVLKNVKANEKICNGIMQQLKRNREKLKELENDMATFHKNTASINALKHDICNLMEKAHNHETLISEKRILEWLDIYVESLLDNNEPKRIQKYLHSSRITLFELLTQYCNQQENGALQAAKTSFTQTDTHKLIGFMLHSERFVLDYFSQKKNEISSWQDDMAHSRLQRLEHVEQSILSELRKRQKLN